MSLVQIQRSVQCHLFSWVNSDCSYVLWGSDHLMLPLEACFLLCSPFCKATGAGESLESSRGWAGGQGLSGFHACPWRPCITPTPFPALAGGLDPDNHDSVFTHLESDILECEVKQALASITINKVSGGTEFQLSYLKS